MHDEDEIRQWLKQLPTKLIASEVGRRNNAKRHTQAGGRPKILRPCPKCKEMMGARDLIIHSPSCSVDAE